MKSWKKRTIFLVIFIQKSSKLTYFLVLWGVQKSKIHIKRLKMTPNGSLPSIFSRNHIFLSLWHVFMLFFVLMVTKVPKNEYILKFVSQRMTQKMPFFWKVRKICWWQKNTKEKKNSIFFLTQRGFWSFFMTFAEVFKKSKKVNFQKTKPREPAFWITKTSKTVFSWFGVQPKKKMPRPTQNEVLMAEIASLHGF